MYLQTSPMTTESADLQGVRGPGRWALLLGCSRTAFHLKTLLPVWLWLGLARVALRRLPSPAAEITGTAVLILGFLVVGAWVSLYTVRELSGGRATGLLDLARGIRCAIAPLLVGALATLAVPTLAVSLAFAGAALARIPAVGGALASAWIFTGGIALSVLAAAWLVVGIPALLLQVTAAGIEFPHSLEITSRCMSYVRNRPSYFVAGSTGALVASFLGTLPFFLLVSLSLVVLGGAVDVRNGDLPDPGGLFWSTVALWSHPETWWPLGLWPEFPLGLYRQSPVTPGWLLDFARLVPAFLVTSLFSGMARLYLCLRREIDGVPCGKA